MDKTPDQIVREAKQEAFLRAYSLTGEIGPACKAAGIGRSTYNRWAVEDEAFKAAADEAKLDAVDNAVAELRQRAVEGTLEPVLIGGLPVYQRDENGDVRLDDNFEPIPYCRVIKSDKLLEVYVKAHRQEFREKGTLEVAGPHGGAIPMSLTLEYVLPAGKTTDDYDRPVAPAADGTSPS